MKQKHTQPPVSFTDEPNAVTIRITGAAFENVKEIAAIFNKWDEGDNTPANIVDRFVCIGDWWTELDKKKPEYSGQTLAGMICDAFHDEPDMPELEAAFEAAGFSTQR